MASHQDMTSTMDNRMSNEDQLNKNRKDDRKWYWMD